MRIACPYCGTRNSEEFAYLGDAALTKRPEPAAGEEAFFDYVYLRDNPRGAHHELWQHVSGCRSWLVVTRDTATHEIAAVAFADSGRGGAE